MNILIVTEEQLDELGALNASGSSDRQLDAVELEDGRRALNGDLLNDCGPGQTWEHYHDFLQALEQDTATKSEFVQEDIP
jgi:hypothetical protein